MFHPSPQITPRSRVNHGGSSLPDNNASIIKPVDRLVLATSASLPLSPEPSSSHSAITEPIWWHCMEEEYATLVSNIS
jgi:hypothetical protein